MPRDSLHAEYLLEETKRLENFADTYIFHDYLAEENHPVYFHEFIAHAASAGLRYLSRSIFSLDELRLSSDFRDVISQFGPDVVRREQYVDFVLHRSFRQSLLCHAGLKTYDSPLPEAIRSLRLVAMARPENPAPDLIPKLASRSSRSMATGFGRRTLAQERTLGPTPALATVHRF